MENLTFEDLVATTGMSYLEKAEFFLSTTCRVVCGFQANDWFKLFTLFPSGFNLGLLSTLNGYEPCNIKCLARVIQDSKSPSGLWNNIVHRERAIDPPEPCMDELDISCLCVMGLYLTNNLSFAEAKQLAETIMDRTIKNEKNQVLACLHTPLLNNEFITSPKMDLGGCINFMWCLSTFQLDDHSELLPTIELITETVEQLIQSQKSGGMFYHSTRFIIYFLLSRYLDCSTLAKEKFGTGFVQLCKTELIEMAKVADTQNALDIAAMLVTTFNLKLHIIIPEPEPKEENVTEIKESILSLKTALIKLQGKDGDFPEWQPYVKMEFGKYANCPPITSAMALVALKKLEQEQF